jgi:chromosome segregation ATPase
MMNAPQATCNGASAHPAGEAGQELLPIDERLREEMERLAAINQELLGKVRPDGDDSEAPGKPDELASLRGENAQLRARIEELEQASQSAPPDEGQWLEQQKEYEALLEEKSEVIRTLHLRIQEREAGTPQEAGTPPAELSEADAADIQGLKKQLEDQRRQLEEDEESLMQQMRQMEMAMSKDRAELARQRNEIQRLHHELNHEIEHASRDPDLRERLVALQRLQGEVTGRKHTIAPLPAKQSLETAAAAPAPGTPEEPAPGDKKKSSGLLRRMFGK